MDDFEKRENDFSDRAVYEKHVQKFSNEEFVRKITAAVESRKRL